MSSSIIAGWRPLPPTSRCSPRLPLARGVFAWAFEAGGHLTASATSSQLASATRQAFPGDRPGDPATTSGEVTTAAVAGVDALDPYFARYLPQLVLGAVVPIVILLRVVTIDVVSAVVMLVTLPLIPIFGILVGRTTEARARARYAALGRLSSHFLNVVRGLTTLRAFNRGAIQADLLAESGEDYRRETMSTLRIAFLSALVLELAATLGTAVIAVEIGVRLDRGDMSLAPALTILVLAPELYAPLRSVAAQFHASADGIAAAGHILDPLEQAAATAPASRERAVVEPLDPRDAPVRLEHVSFAYPGREGDVLRDASLALGCGERVALVGPSGAGKSTIARLLLRFDRPEWRPAARRWHRSRRCRQRCLASAPRMGAAETAPLGRDHRRGDPSRRARCGDLGGRRCCAARGCRGVHRRAAGRVRHAAR